MSGNPTAQEMGLECNRDPFTRAPASILWGVAPTGDIHLGYVPSFCLLQRLRDMGTQVNILVANYHAYLDSQKTNWIQLDERTKVYRRTLELGGFRDANVIEARDYYLSKDYIESLYEISGHLSVSSLAEAGQTTLRADKKKSKLADLVYVATQVLDVKYLGVDAVLCGMDESPIYRFGLPLLERDYKIECGYIYMPMSPGVEKAEMHASDPVANKILITDGPSRVYRQVSRHVASLPDFKSRQSLVSYCRDTMFPLAGYADLTQTLYGAIDAGDIRKVISTLTEGILRLLKPWQE